jgi:hypothetical protein
MKKDNTLIYTKFPKHGLEDAILFPHSQKMNKKNYRKIFYASLFRFTIKKMWKLGFGREWMKNLINNLNSP